MYFLDQSRGSFKALSVSPKLDQTGSQKATRDGLPQWTIETLFTPETGKSELLSVGVAATSQPEIVPMAEVALRGLRLGFWESGDRAGLFFQADSVEAASLPLPKRD